MKKILVAALAAGLLASCGGGGGTLPRPSSQSASSSGRQVQVAFSITIPRSSASTSAAKRRPAYIAPDTQSAIVDVTSAGAPSTHTIIACGGTSCTGNVPATVGTDTFVISLNDRLDGTGKTLASGTTTQTVVEGKPNSVTVTFNGIVASLSVTVDTVNPPTHQTAKVTVHVTAFDPDGSTIVGPGVYDNPITVTDGDTSGASSMAPETIDGPSDPAFTVTYNGAWIGGDCACVPIIASVPNNSAVKPATGRIIPVPGAVEYTIPTASSTPIDLAKGSDGAIWFTEQYGHKVGRVTTSGSITEYPVPGSGSPSDGPSQPWAITAGGDGNLWITDANGAADAIDSITTAGTVTRFSIQRPSGPRELYQMVWGPDGNLWAPDAGANQIVRFTPTGTETDFAIPTAGANAQYITDGPDGAVWFTEYGAGKIGRVTTAGAITEYSTAPPANGDPYHTSWPLGITSGPDGALWYTDSWLNTIGHATTSGTVTQFPRVQNESVGGPIITGPDGALYFNAFGGSIGRISTSGTITILPIQQIHQRGGQPYRFAVGSDNDLWYVDTYGNVVGKIVF